jgi:hypothetical protein
MECSGHWWLPGDEKNQVGGTLYVSSNGGLRLSLLGSLGNSTPGSMPFNKDHGIILGLVDKSPNGHYVTLTESFLLGLSSAFSLNQRESYHPHLAYFGAHLPQESDFTFKHLVLELTGLTDWATPLSGFERPVPIAHETEKSTSLGSYKTSKPVRGTVPDGSDVALFMSLGGHWTVHEYNYREQARLEVECANLKSTGDLSQGFVYPLQNLLTFVCDRPQKVERFSVWRTEDCLDFARNPEIRVVGPRIQPEDDTETRSVHRHDMLFTLADVDFGETIAQWFRLAGTYVDACNIFFGLQYGPPAFVDIKFLGVLQVLQLYYARRADGLALREREERRLREIVSILPTGDGEWLVDRLGICPYPQLRDVLNALIKEHSEVFDPLVSSREDRFISEVINTEYHVTRRDPEVRGVALHGAGLYWMTQKLRILVSACFLRELGFSTDKIHTVFRRNATYQHICQLDATRESSATAPKI